MVSSGLRVRASGDLLPRASFTDPFPECPGPGDSVKDLGLKMGRPEAQQRTVVGSGLSSARPVIFYPRPSFTDSFPACRGPGTR
jgi:hypothetical protein